MHEQLEHCHRYVIRFIGVESGRRRNAHPFSRETVLALASVLALWSGASARAADLPQVVPGADASPVLTVDRVDISRRRERQLLGPGGRAALYAVATARQPFNPDAEPLILVHGLVGSAAELSSVVERLDGAFQPYLMLYDDLGRRTSLSGDDLAAAIARRARGEWRGRDVTIVAHSLGGIVARRALDRLALDPGHSLEALGRVRLVAVDSPWHGFAGPSDRGAGRAAMALVRPLLPDGLEDMRARSSLFVGDPGSEDATERAGLFGVALPDSVVIDLVFAARGAQVLDYTEGVLAQLPAAIAAWYAHDQPVRGEQRIVNYWRALLSSSNFAAFREELEPLARAGRLEAAAVSLALARHFPRFAGDHVSVLAAGSGLIDHLAVTLSAGAAPRPTLALSGPPVLARRDHGQRPIPALLPTWSASR